METFLCMWHYCNNVWEKLKKAHICHFLQALSLTSTKIAFNVFKFWEKLLPNEFKIIQKRLIIA